MGMDASIQKFNRTMPELNDYVTTKEAASLLGFHVNHIRRMRRQGDLEAIKIGSIWLISKNSINHYKEEIKKFDSKFDRRRGNE